MVELIQELRGIDSACVAAPFDTAKAELESKGYEVISLEENAGLRIQEGKDAFVSRYGNWTREGILYVPKKGIFLTKKSPIMLNSQEATKCNRRGDQFFPTSEQVEQSLEDSVELPLVSRPRWFLRTLYCEYSHPSVDENGFLNIDLEVRPIPTNRLGDCDITTYVFGNAAVQYGEFLRNFGINEISIRITSLQQSRPFARQLWFRNLDFKSTLNCCDGGLNYDIRLRGIKKDTKNPLQ